MTVREARLTDDNAALVALAAKCSMEGDLSLCIDRAPDFFALNRIGGDAWRVGVVDGDDGPIGCIATTRRPSYLDGGVAELGYIGDLKVHPEHRRRGVGGALVRWAVGAARDMVGQDGPLIATTLAGNAAVDTLRHRFEPGARRWATIRSHSINLLWKRRLPQVGLTVRPAGPEDVPGMVALWRRMGRQFAPALESFDMRVSGLDYLVAHRRDGEPAGFLGVWDQHRIKQMRVTGYSPRLATARVAFNLAASLFRAPRLPAPGQALSYRTVVHPCAADPETLRMLLAFACNELRGQCSFVTIGLDTRDPLTRALSGMLAQPTDVDLLVLGGPTDHTVPVHFEIATV